MRKFLYFVHLILAASLLIFSVYWMSKDIVSIGKLSVGSMLCFSFPAPLIIPLALLSFGYLQQGPRSFCKFIPLILSAAAILAAIILYSYEKTHPDFAFLRDLSKNEHVVDSINRGEIEINQAGLGPLPEGSLQYFAASMVYVTETPARKILFFEEGSDSFDYISWGYLHTSDGNPPVDDCGSWRELVPPTPNWFFCDSHRWIGLLE